MSIISLLKMFTRLALIILYDINEIFISFFKQISTTFGSVKRKIGKIVAISSGHFMIKKFFVSASHENKINILQESISAVVNVKH